MDKLVLQGGKPLFGEVQISGAKNAVLPIMAATLLADGEFTIHNVPELRDVKTMAHLLRIIGAKVAFQNNTLVIDTSGCNYFEAPYELVKTMRASIYVLGPLLGRFGQAKVSLPGGCAIGARPVDFHLKGMDKLGAQISLDAGYIKAKSAGLNGGHIHFDIPSVGATGNILMAAVLAKGKTTISNASCEPEIVALADFLITMGAQIDGVGSSNLTVQGVKQLKPTHFTVIPDRVETGTFMIAAALTGGEVTLTESDPSTIGSLTEKLREAGNIVEQNDRRIYVKGAEKNSSVDITTSEYPGFPTDLQAQWMTLMCLAGGASMITDTIFFDRFTHAAELKRLGATIELKKNTAIVTGVEKLYGAQVMSTDLRASASLVLAGLVAEGQTEVHRIYHLDRGYERIEDKLQKVGAEICRSDGGL